MKKNLRRISKFISIFHPYNMYKILAKLYSLTNDNDPLHSFFRKNQISNLTIFDVGANIGQSALSYVSKMKKAVVYSFEPNPKVYEELNLLRNERIISFNFGLSNFDGAMEFNLNELDATSSLLELNETAADNWEITKLKNGTSTILSFRTLDSILGELGVEIIDFMKIDVQGAEWMVLDGSINAIKNKKILMIQMEYIYAETYSETKNLTYYLDFFELNGYRLVSIFDFSRNSRGDLLQFELLFKLKML